MTEAMPLRPCPRDGCYPDNGSGCIEGLDPRECPHRHGFSVPEGSVEEPGVETENAVLSGTVRVHNGDALSAVEADAFLRRQDSAVVAFVGCPDAGKTTAAIMLYELIKRNRLKRIGFAGSNTIRGFQLRSFKSLLASGLAEPNTDRTRRSTPVAFLHLRICIDQQKRVFSDVLLSDRSGEDFEACISKPNLCASYPEIIRADCHVLLLDGNKLINSDLAALHVAEVRRIFISLIRSPLKRLQVVLTKFDKIAKSENKDMALQHYEHLFQEFVRRAKSDFSITAHKLAARPNYGDDLLGHGLEALVLEWFSAPEEIVPFKKVVPALKDGSPYELLLNTLGARN